MTDRFDNFSVEQLREADLAARQEAIAVERALIARLEAEHSIIVDRVYRVRPLAPDGNVSFGGRLDGRLVKVTNVRAFRSWKAGGADQVHLWASVRPKLASKKDTPTSDGFGRKHHWVDPDRLEPVETEQTK